MSTKGDAFWPLISESAEGRLQPKPDATPLLQRGRNKGGEARAVGELRTIEVPVLLAAYFLAWRSIRTLPITESATPAVVSQPHANFSKKNEIASAAIGTITPM